MVSTAYTSSAESVGPPHSEQHHAPMLNCRQTCRDLRQSRSGRRTGDSPIDGLELHAVESALAQQLPCIPANVYPLHARRFRRVTSPRAIHHRRRRFSIRLRYLVPVSKLSCGRGHRSENRPCAPSASVVVAHRGGGRRRRNRFHHLLTISKPLRTPSSQRNIGVWSIRGLRAGIP